MSFLESGSKYSLGSCNQRGKKMAKHILFDDDGQVVKKPKLEKQTFKAESKVQRTDFLEQKKSLPVCAVEDRLVEEIRRHPTVIIIGETGSGKTTQIPQIILRAGLAKGGVIGVTQPRRVAATTVAIRVAQEMTTKLGGVVGYTVRFEDATSKATQIKYLTDGMLLREALLDRNMLKYSVIVLDEVHERTLHTDVLFGIVREAQVRRIKNRCLPLRVLLMSATMDVDQFSQYFGNAAVIYLEGRQHPVKVFNMASARDDYFFNCIVTLFQLHRQAPANHDILIFLTGQEEIEAMAQNIKLVAKDLEGKALPPLLVCPLYAAMPSHTQMAAFRQTPSGIRKVVLSTNIAETSVTITGIKYVIDSGMVKARIHSPRTGLDILKVERISQAQAWQRAGRAGREGEGFCYRTYTLQEYESMSENSKPEILRCNLASVVLQLLALGIDPTSFDFMDQPSPESIAGAVSQLKLLGAVSTGSDNKLTQLGHTMSLFPLDPRFSKVILSAKDFGCVSEIITLVALLSGESVLVNPASKRGESKAAHKKFESLDGDHLTLLNIYKAYEGVVDKKKWCLQNFLNLRNLAYASEVRRQLLQLSERCSLPMSSCGDNLDSVRKCLVTGFFMNMAELQKKTQYVTVSSRQPAAIHPSSVLFSTQAPCVLFTELVQTGRCYLRQLSVVEPQWLHEVAPKYFKKHRLTNVC